MLLCFTQLFSLQFLFPCSLVVINDTAAYICGRLFGKRKLLNISPKKTMEGFVGAGIVTVLIAFKNTTVYNHIQFHGMVIGIFASIVAPFGGFFSSAVKRAGKIKDFGQWIPGHGGLLDRVDCQLFMAVFTFVYFKYISST
ncbi:phosphatidate cytidylyltransferase [Mucor mucedo]|uniref:phosphatidate cytidylyltransferase n=1 Tax=Mucor mucedo TaxID=29922 RepID=UPI00221F46CE|nr:phosphatidate cytidylyltransferase [Mucor mucedo]KAI7895722.1 phosphatidate cytidylyltransferase [Mucor mucedo]